MRLNETKRKQRTSQEEVLAEMFAEAELQDSVRKKKNWDAWMESEVEQQIDEEIRKYLAESSDPTVYLTPKEAKAWNRMPKSKQQRLLQKESKQVFKEWQAGERKAFAGAERRPDDLREDLVFLQSGRIRLGKQRTGMAGQARIWKPGRLPRMPEKSKGNVRSVPERMQRESGNAKTGRTGGMGAGSGVDVVGSYSSGGSSGTAGAQKTAASAAGSTAPVTPATLATRTAKKTAHTFKEYIQGVNQAAQQAIGEERAKYPCTPDMCAQWVTGIYQAAGAPTIPYGNAIDMWNNYKNTGNTSMENIPPGAIVCGSGYGSMGSIYGHVGIYLGNGMVANNRGYFSVESLEEWCSWQTATCQGHTGWIGWVFPGGVPAN